MQDADIVQNGPICLFSRDGMCSFLVPGLGKWRHHLFDD